MPSFTESDLLFRFPDDWVVRKFDQTAAYQSLSGRGLKGVDFIALSPDGRLWLMEVKNYRPRTTNDREYRAKRRPPADLGHHVWSKFKDSHRLLKIVDASLRRKWWFRLWDSYRSVFPAAHSNYWFWIEAQRRVDREAVVVYLLWMETPEKNPDYNAAVAASLREALPSDATVLVVESPGNTAVPVGAYPL